MAGFSDLIGAFMQSALTSSGSSRMGSVLEHLQRSGSDGQAVPHGGGGILGGILGQLGGGRDVAGEGTLALLAGVAMQALQGAGRQAQPSGASVGSGEQMPLAMRAPETRDEVDALEGHAQLVLKGMINAAKSDGQISPQEMQHILTKLQEAGIDQDARQWVMEQMAEPLDLAAFTAEIPSQEVAAQVYAGSLLAIEVDTDAERAYLRQLAERTGLQPMVVDQIHQTFGVVV